MTYRVLTDNELKATYYPYSAVIDGLRAVEAAVIAKMTPVYGSKDSMFPPPVTEREARKRERAAWSAALHFAGRLVDGLNYGPRYDYPEKDPEKERDRLYPLPTVKRPRTVTLSYGMTVHATRLEWGKPGWIIESASRCVPGAALPYEYAKTPEDAEKLADLVRHPYEEMPE
jgi:hypothetical protein